MDINVSLLLLFNSFYIADKFGDGWDTALFFVYDTHGYYRTTAPKCLQEPTYLYYCFDPMTAITGDSVTAAVYGFNPEAPWEVRDDLNDNPLCTVITSIFYDRSSGKQIYQPAEKSSRELLVQR